MWFPHKLSEVVCTAERAQTFQNKLTTVLYINSQGNVHSAQLLEMARSLVLWSHRNLCSITDQTELHLHPRKTEPSHWPDVMHRSRGMRGGCSNVVGKVCESVKKSVHLKTRCALWLSISSQDDPTPLPRSPWFLAVWYAFRRRV